ncbi:MAG TPA: NAD-dependent epimerase/dehydratase family protein, partial [Acidimicrobiales bacterium]|nr:NAD-dependent epimerase/dehydratase family protein [Acidimicrobiales bacterium]
AWTAKALEDAGHEVRLFVRTPEKQKVSTLPIGVRTGDVASGDITDAASVVAAMEGCDSVVHCAAVVATDRRRADEMLQTNLVGARNVLGAAAERGLDPIVHVSSITALFRRRLDRMHADLDVGGLDDAYGRTKAAEDRYARELQQSGAPIVVVYPGMVLGPPAGEQFGEVAEGVETVLKRGVVPGIDAAWTLVDVRDLGFLIAALMVPGQGPRRYMAGGHHLTPRQLRRDLESVTGRRLIPLALPGLVLRGLGRAMDAASRALPINSVLTEAAMEYYTRMPPTDDTPSEKELGVVYRPSTETLADAIAGLARVGRITARQAGPRVAAAPTGGPLR